MEVSIADFGRTKTGQLVQSFTLRLADGVACTLISRGGAISQLLLPDSSGSLQDVVLGYDTLEGYESPTNPFHGTLVGRCCNRIGDASFVLDGRLIQLARNAGRHHLHGGRVGFDKAIWQGEPIDDPAGPAVRFRHHSPDGDEAYPGNLDVTVTYVLTRLHELVIRYEAVSDQKTVINLTSHVYFNLAGHDAGPQKILEHEVEIAADAFTVTDADSIPTGEIATVAGTALDFRSAKPVGRDIGCDEEPIRIAGGFDHNYCLPGQPGVLRLCAAVREPASGRMMQVLTTSPGIQLYTGNHMRPDTGKGGAAYGFRSGLCLETQYYPNSVNIPHFPSPVFEAGEQYRHETVYRFSVSGDQS